MTTKQILNAGTAPDGGRYVVLTDGDGNLAPASGGSSSNPNGQSTMANSAPVVIASNQTAVPVTLTSTTITGTVAATQSGTWTVQPGNTANTTAWKVDGSAVTQPVSGSAAVGSPPVAPPLSISGVDGSGNKQHVKVATDGTIAVSAASLPLPSGAATSAGLTTINTTLGSPLQAGGAVSVTAIVPGTSATNLGKAEDSAHASGDVGVFGLALANEAQTVLAQDGDYIGHGADTKGNTFVTGPVASAATDSGNPIKVGGKYNAAVQAFTNGQRADLQLDQRGGLLIQDGQAIPSVSVTSATTLFTVADTSGYGTASIQITSIGSGNTVIFEGSEDGTTWSAVQSYNPGSQVGITSSTTTSVGITFVPIISKQFRARVSTYGSGTITAQGSLRNGALPKQTVAVGGGMGDGGSISNNAVLTVVETRTTNKTAVASGTVIRPIATSIGAAVNKPFQVPELDWAYPAAAGGISNTTTAVTMVAAAGVGIRNYMTAIQMSAPTLGAATEVAVRDGAGGTVLWRGYMSTAGGNQSVNLSSPVKSTANTLLEVVTLSATVTGAIYINAQGYQAP